MSSSYGENFRLTIFGQSHSEAIGMTLDGIPAGCRIDEERLCRFLARRAPGRSRLSTQRKEADRPRFLCGLKDGFTCGAPLAAIIENTDAKPGEYVSLKGIPRPGHADYTAEVKYSGFEDASGGGHFSGRLTAPLCIAGGILLQLLEAEGITVISRIAAIGGISDTGELTEELSDRPFPVVDAARGEQMLAAIEAAQAAQDSLGGIVECRVLGLPAGLGDPMFDGMENRIAQAVFAIPSVKGVEFGEGFAAAALPGSVNNDAFAVEEGRIITKTNHAGGILGGITDGMPLVFRAAFKPVPSIGKKQESVNLGTMEPAVLEIRGRHDPCILPRALPCVEAAAALAVYDALLGRRKETGGSRV